MFWLIASALSLSAMLLIARPLLLSRRKQKADVGDDAENLGDELAAVRRDIEFGLVDATAAATVEAEARSRAAATGENALENVVSRAGRLAAVAALGLSPLAAGLLYLKIGAPEAFDAARRAPAATTVAAEGEIISALEARVESSPEDFEGWMALGEAYALVNRAPDAAEAYRRAAALRTDEPIAQSSFGEALVFASNGAITEEARQAFERTLTLAPSDPRARYYLAEARYQVGAIDEALRGWAALLNEAGADAPWFAAVAGRMSAAADEANISLAALGLDEATLQRIETASEGGAAIELGPGDPSADAIAAMPEEERRRMIEGMVAGLAERLKVNPDDPEGWRMLARSYGVLGRPSDGATAWREFLGRADPSDDDWRQYAYALIEMRPVGDETVSPELERALLKIQEFNSEDPLTLYQLGLAARDRGENEKAVELWTRLQNALPPGAPFADTLAELIEETR